MAVDKIRNEIGYQRENQTNIERAGNWLTDSGLFLGLTLTSTARQRGDCSGVAASRLRLVGSCCSFQSVSNMQTVCIS